MKLTMSKDEMKEVVEKGIYHFIDKEWEVTDVSHTSTLSVPQFTIDVEPRAKENK